MNNKLLLSLGILLALVVSLVLAIPVAAQDEPQPPTLMVTVGDGGALFEGDIPVSVQVSNFNIVDKIGEPAVAGEGHFIYYLDTPIPSGQGIPDSGMYLVTSATSITWPGVLGGSHTFSVQLVNNDNTPLDPQVTSEVTIVVNELTSEPVVNELTPEPGVAPAVAIISPADGATLDSGNIQVSILVSNQNIVDKQGEAAVAGEGHIHFYLDTQIPIAPGEPAVSAPGTYISTADTSVTWQNVAPGTHTLGVQLVNNDHTPLDPPVYTTITVTVQPAPAAPVSSTNWWLVGGLIAAGVVILGLILYFSMRRRVTA